MRPLPKKCEASNTVTSFCDCISEEKDVDAAAEGFCKRAAENPGKVTGDELVELKHALNDLEEFDADDEGCCDC
jgi:hypothetical protein